MADALICPVCGEANPADMEFCRNCQSRLRPLPGSLKDEGGPIQPGELPTKKSTSELEPLLPQWLREARQQARESGAAAASNLEPEQPSPTAASGSDLLAGLASKGRDDEEEIPDWLASITGVTGKKKKPAAEESQVKWVELGHEEKGQTAARESETETPPMAATGSSNEDLAEWFKQAATPSKAPEQDSATSVSGAMQDVPSVEAFQNSSVHEDLGWLRNLDTPTSHEAAGSTDETTHLQEEVPDWLRQLPSEQTTPTANALPAQPAPEYSTDVPDWLKQLPAEPTSPIASQPSEQTTPTYSADIPDWLKQFGSESAESPESRPAKPEPQVPVEQVPDWLQAAGFTAAEVKSPVEQPAAEEPILPVELPDWVSALGDSANAPTATAEPAKELPAAAVTLPEPAATEPITPVQVPDWISSLGQDSAAQPPTEPASRVPALESMQPEHAPEDQTVPNAPSALVPSTLMEQGASGEVKEQVSRSDVPAAPGVGAAFASEGLTGESVDAIFNPSLTPDWLASISPSQNPAEEIPPAVPQQGQPIVPAELPSWVQAMRPVEPGTLPAAEAKESPTEELGPLAGLRGVLPTIPGALAPSSKPKPYSNKLTATEQQQAHAALLEQILAAETSPIPMRAGEILRSQRALRWVLSLLVIVVAAVSVYLGSQVFSLPTAAPNETVNAIQVVEALPEGAPVLLVFDYQPATVGELEATGASLIDHLIVMKHPYLALLSTYPTGSALAERFMSSVLVDKGRPKYARDVQYADLGYLPGGLAGVYNFAQNPRTIVPLVTNYGKVLQSAGLGPIQGLSDFAAIIVLTDSEESGRTWVEQTQAWRGSSPMLMVSSAQAGPMLMPYVDSGQVNGMVSGIYGAAAVEQRNAGSPAAYSAAAPAAQEANLPGYVRRYWDAYNAGLYLAVVLIVVGGLWHLWLGLRDRRAQAA